MALKLGRLPCWETVESGEVDDHGVFGVQHVRRCSPRTGKVGSYQILHMPDWVNVVALTPEYEVILVEQYRHGTDILTLEIPGGAVDGGEDPAAAAARELREETGHAGDAPRLLGTVRPNPAIQTNACSTWLITNAVEVCEPEPDEGEHIAILTTPLADVRDLLRDGTIDHSLVVAAFYWLELAREPGGGEKLG